MAEVCSFHTVICTPNHMSAILNITTNDFRNTPTVSTQTYLNLPRSKDRQYSLLHPRSRDM